MINKKVLDFLTSDNFYEILEEIEILIEIDPFKDKDKDSLINHLLTKYFTLNLYDKELDNFLSDYINKNLNFLDDDKKNKLINFFNEKIKPLKEEIGRNEKEKLNNKEINKENFKLIDEDFDEKEKKYIEIISKIIEEKKINLPETENKKIEQTEPQKEIFKKIIITPQKNKSSTKKMNINEEKSNLPQSVIIKKIKPSLEKTEEEPKDFSEL